MQVQILPRIEPSNNGGAADSMSGHTPGPWIAGWGGGITGPNAAEMVEWEGKYPIHRVVTRNGYQCREPICAVPDADEHHQANARLIAAAPDLLEAARRVIGLDNDPHPGLATWCQLRSEAGDMLRAAYAKATHIPADESVQS
jgi:hypothetical protein